MTVADLVLTVLGSMGAAAVLYLTWRAPAWAVGMVVLSVPLQGHAIVGAGSTGITWTQAWLWSFLAMGSILYVVGAFSIRIDLVMIGFGLVVACYATSRGEVVAERLWLNELYRWGIALAFFLVARGLMSGRRSLLPLVVSSIVGAMWTGGLAVAQVLGDVGPASFERAGVSRAYASFGEPNTFGAFAGLCAIPLVTTLLAPEASVGRWVRRASWGGAGLGLLGLALSQSRGALAAFAAVTCLVLLARMHRGEPVLRAGAAVVIVAGSLLIVPRLAEIAFGDRQAVETISASWADRERAAHWEAAVRMVMASDGAGVGAGQFDQRYRELTPAWRFRIPQGHAHNAYLQVTAETGLLGGVIYVSLIATVLVTLARRLVRGHSSVLVGSAVAVTAAFAIHNLVDYLHVLNLPLILVAWWAAALGQSEGSSQTL